MNIGPSHIRHDLEFAYVSFPNEQDFGEQIVRVGADGEDFAAMHSKRVAALMAALPKLDVPHPEHIDVFSNSMGRDVPIRLPALAQDEFPSEIILRPRTKLKFYPIMWQGQFGYFVTEALKAAIERRDPDAAEFIPVRIRTEDGRLDEPYYLLHILRLDQIVAKQASGYTLLEETINLPPIGDITTRRWQRGYLDISAHILRADNVAGRHVIASCERIFWATLFSREVLQEAGILANPDAKVEFLTTIQLNDGEE